MQLLSHLPDFLQEYREYQYILDEADQPELDWVDDQLEKDYNNFFVLSADEDGCSRYEKMYGLTPQPSATLEERRFAILSYLNKQLPYTERQLNNILTTLCGEGNFTVTLTPSEYSIAVKLGLAAKNNRDSVDDLLHYLLPANLIYAITILWNQHSKYNGKWTHAQMAKYTHTQLREEEINVG
ncbi:MAG: putative phage tail protein [Eubacterium sp.]